MSVDSFFEQFSCSEFINYINSVIDYYARSNGEKYSDIRKDLAALGNRINDENLYLGVIGSFSSGKSTFINSVIHKNLLPTDAVQGTTVAASVLKRADFDDLEIAYLDGTVKRYSECTTELLSRYQIEGHVPSTIESISLWERFIDWLKKLLGIAIEDKPIISRTDERIDLFKKIIATEDMAKDVQCVTLYYQNDNIPYRIAMVDTPGTESLNARHNEVTKNAIENICDAIVVIIPYDEPVSEDLLNYVNSHLDKQKQECIFVVTKVELLGDREELPQLMRVIKKRLENGLGIESACVIPMPTLIYLKETDTEMQTTFLDNIPEEEKRDLIQLYEEGLEKINERLNTNRINYIKKKIINICERVSSKLNANLTDVVLDYEEKNKQLQSEAVEPISTFESAAKSSINKLIESYQQRTNGEVSFVNVTFSEICSEIEKSIDRCNDSQDLLSALNYSIKPAFAELSEAISKQLSKSEDGICSKLRDMQKDFMQQYEKCGVIGQLSIINIDSQDFYTEEFISDCETTFQNRISSVRYSIRNETTGFFKKIKAIFSNPFSKQKELATTELSEVINEINRRVVEYSTQMIKQKNGKAKRDAEYAVNSMVDLDRGKIEEYIKRINESLNHNNQGKESTQVCINRLQEYIRLIKEVG